MSQEAAFYLPWCPGLMNPLPPNSHLKPVFPVTGGSTSASLTVVLRMVVAMCSQHVAQKKNIFHGTELMDELL